MPELFSLLENNYKITRDSSGIFQENKKKKNQKIQGACFRILKQGDKLLGLNEENLQQIQCPGSAVKEGMCHNKCSHSKLAWQERVHSTGILVREIKPHFLT